MTKPLMASFYRVAGEVGVVLRAGAVLHTVSSQSIQPEYLAMVREAGFAVPDSAVSYPFLWWSREDLGLMETALRIKPPAVREATLINLVAVKPGK